jgi:hypothetical protein
MDIEDKIAKFAPVKEIVLTHYAKQAAPSG